MITVSNDLLAIKSTMPDDLSTASGASFEASGADRLY